jgi:hypothetical protein
VGNRIGHSEPAGDGSRTVGGTGGTDRGGGSGLVPQRELRVLEPPSAPPSYRGRWGWQLLSENGCPDPLTDSGPHPGAWVFDPAEWAGSRTCPAA